MSGPTATASDAFGGSARRLGWAFAGLAAASFGLIVLGALVRANGAGLACPDWPLCFGALIPAFDVRVAFEWSHRALAGGVSLGLAVVCGLLWRARPDDTRLVRPLVLLWTLLVVQVVLGGLTVLLRLAPWTVTAHLLVGTGFCLGLVWISRDLFEWSRPAAGAWAATSASRNAALALAVGLLLVQFTLGGMVASHAAGLACAEFPTCNGSSLVPSLKGLVGLHVLHRGLALALLLAYAWLAWATRGATRAAGLARLGLRLVVIQIAIGAGNVLLQLPVELTALHSALAVALALVTGLLARETLWARARQPDLGEAVGIG